MSVYFPYFLLTHCSLFPNLLTHTHARTHGVKLIPPTFQLPVGGLFYLWGSAKVAGWLPIIKSSSSWMTPSTVIDFPPFFFSFSHNGYNHKIQLADVYSTAVSLNMNLTL